MHVLDAVDQTANEFPGGCEALSSRVGISAGVLRNKVNPNNPSNHLTLVEADRLMRVTGDHRILHALAASHGFVLQLADEAAAAAQELVDVLVLELMQKSGALAGTIAEAKSDGVITPNEAKDTAGAGFDVQNVVVRLVAAIHAQVRVQP